jgi:ADP-ribose pyrophosphatase YjhB (NUDIX family)
MADKRFNIRVYGILENSSNEVLLVHERINDFAFTKFPGGGLEFGEGIKDCLIREFREETGLTVEVSDHVYTTDFFQESAFCNTDQLISVYYRVKSGNTLSIRLDEHEIQNNGRTESLRFFWVKREELKESMLTFPIDKLVCGLIA